MKHHLIVIFIALISNLWSQAPQGVFCPIDITQDFTLVVHVENEGERFKHYFELRYTKPNRSIAFRQQHIDNFDEFIDSIYNMPFDHIINYRDCESYYGKYSKLDNSFETYTTYKWLYDENGAFESSIGPFDTIYFRIPKHRLKALEIIIRFDFEHPKVIDLSSLDFTKEINLEQFESISISAPLYRYDYALMINLKQWEGYAKAVQKNVLSELVLNYPNNDRNFSEHIKPFTNLRKLVARGVYIDIEPQHFTKAEKPFEINTHFFDLKMYQYPNLILCESHFFGEPEFHFFVSHASIKIPGHPLHEIDSLVQKRLNVNPLKSGFVYLTEKQFVHNSDADFLSDNIIAQGQIENGLPVGIWKFHISIPFIQYLQKHCGGDHLCYENWRNIADLDLKEFQYNYSENKPITFPEDGSWQFYYSNGTLAIEGQFKDSKRNGIWKFYQADGKLRLLQTFLDDKPRGLEIHYFNDGNNVQEFRHFHFDDCTYIGSKP
jgi:hypothetical protein